MWFEGHFASKCYCSQVQKQVQEMATEERLMATEEGRSVGVFISTIDSLKSDNAWTVQLETNGSMVRYKLDTAWSSGECASSEGLC